jgi:hypothetical protein
VVECAALTPSWKSAAWSTATAAAIGAVAVAAWSPLLHHFFFDDDLSLVALAAKRSLRQTLHADLFGYFHGEESIPYWRPGWHVLFLLAQRAFGIEAGGYYAIAVALHASNVVALFLVQRRLGVPRAIAAAAALVFALAVGPAEAVGWVAAAFNVLPCALLLLVAGTALLDWYETRSRRCAAVAFGTIALSFLFREAAYQLMLLHLLAAPFLLRAAARRAPGEAPLRVSPAVTVWRPYLLSSALFAAVVFVHYRWFNHVSPPRRSIGEEWTSVAVAITRRVEALVGVLPSGPSSPDPASTITLLAVVAGSTVVALWSGARARFAFAWTAAALFPYVAVADQARFGYFLQLPFSLALGLAASDAVRARPNSRLVHGGVLALLLGFALWNGARLPAEQRLLGERGERWRARVDALRRVDLSGLRAVAFDDPDPLLEDWVPVFEVFGRTRLPLVPCALFRRDPFVIYTNPQFDELGDDVAFLEFDEASATFRRRTRRDVVGSLVALPRFALLHEAVVASGKPRALAQRIVDGRVDARRQLLLSESAPLEPPLVLLDPRVGPPGAHDQLVARRGAVVDQFDLDVESVGESLLALRFTVDLTKTRSRVLVDGAETAILGAEGFFDAVRIAAGRHHVHLDLSGVPFQ